MLSIQRRPRPVIQPDQVDAFLAAVDAQGNLHASFLIPAQLLMGMRSMEARHMKWSGLRLDQKVYIPDRTKNGDAPIMPIPEAMQPWFDRLRGDGMPLGLMCPAATGRPHEGHFTSRYIKRAAKAIGFTGNLSEHRLRASFASILNTKGVPLPTIQKLMRHSRVETTMIYIETRESEMRSAINLVG